MNTFRSRQAGLGLIEIMIALVLALLVLTGVYTVFISDKASYRLQSGVSRVQENARFAAYRLAHDIRMAGYMGCFSNAQSITNDLNDPNSSSYPLSDYAEAIHGYTAGNVPSALGVSGAVAGTDVIMMHTTRGAAVTVTDIPSDHSVDFKIAPSPTNPFSEGDIALITDCQNGDLFQITHVNYNSSNLQGNVVHNTGNGSGLPSPGNAIKFANVYTGGAMIQRMTTATYFIRNDSNSGRPALWVKEGDNSAQELVQGVDNMQVRYGLSSGGDYLSAASVSNWSDVTSVEIALLLESPDPATGNSKAEQYTLIDTQSAKYTDRRFRRVFTFAVAIRNRL